RVLAADVGKLAHALLGPPLRDRPDQPQRRIPLPWITQHREQRGQVVNRLRDADPGPRPGPAQAGAGRGQGSRPGRGQASLTARQCSVLARGEDLVDRLAVPVVGHAPAAGQALPAPFVPELGFPEPGVPETGWPGGAIFPVRLHVAVGPFRSGGWASGVVTANPSRHDAVWARILWVTIRSQPRTVSSGESPGSIARRRVRGTGTRGSPARRGLSARARSRGAQAERPRRARGTPAPRRARGIAPSRRPRGTAAPWRARRRAASHPRRPD